MLEQARRAGCWAILYGFESGDQALLDVVNKGFTLEDSRRAARLTHAAGLDTRASFMLALPGETPALARKTVDFAIELDVTFAQFLPTFPEPGTKLFEIAQAEGRIAPFASRTRAAYIPRGYASGEEVEGMVREAYRRFYLRPAYVWKHLKRLRSWAMARHYFNAFLFFLGLLRK
jgi:anaerobic magnesium-protoporphyrin IX monomethyl ester cyclase